MAPDEMTAIQVEVPRAWTTTLADPVALLEVLSLGIQEYRIRQALDLYQQGGMSLAYAAEQVGLPRRLLMERARQYNVLPPLDEEEPGVDLAP